MLPLVLGLVGGVVAVLLIVIKSSLDQASSRREFGDDPVQRRLAGHVDAYTYSTQDDDAYAAFAEAVRREFEVLGVASKERVQRRLMHAAGLNYEQVKQGLKKKPTPAQTTGAARALIRISEEL